MEDMYKLVKDFFSHDMDLDDLFDSEAGFCFPWGFPCRRHPQSRTGDTGRTTSYAPSLFPA